MSTTTVKHTTPNYPQQITESVTLEQPPEREISGKGPLLQKILKIYMPIVMVSVIVIMIATGGRQMGMFMVMMAMGMVSMLVGQFMGGDKEEEIEKNRRYSSRSLNQHREAVHTIGRAQHRIATLNFPNVEAIPSLVRPTPHATLWAVTGPGTTDTSAGQLSFLTARVGQGNVELDPPITIEGEAMKTPDALDPAIVDAVVRFQNIHNLLPAPTGIALSDFAFGFRSDDLSDESIELRYKLAETIAMSLAYTHSPNVLHLGVISTDLERWDWLKWLPHSLNTFGEVTPFGYEHLAWSAITEKTYQDLADLAKVATSCDEYFVIFVDTPRGELEVPERLTSNAAVRKDGNRLVIDNVVFVAVRTRNDRAITTPQSRIKIDRRGLISTFNQDSIAKVDSHSHGDLLNAAYALASVRPQGFGNHTNLHDNTTEEVGNVDAPDLLDAYGVDNLDTYNLTGRWAETDRTDSLRAPIGFEVSKKSFTPTGEVTYLNVQDASVGYEGATGPHGQFIGRTGTGKSFTLQSILLGLVFTYSPERLNILGLDFKGGSTFLNIRDTPHVISVISNLEGAVEMLDRAWDVISGELAYRQEMFDQYGVDGLASWNKKRRNDPSMPNMPALLIVADELREFITNYPEYRKMFDKIASIGRSIGIYMLLTSQYFDGTILGDATVTNSTYGIALSSANASHSRFTIGTGDAANLPQKSHVAILKSATMTGDTYTWFKGFNHGVEYIRPKEVTGPIDLGSEGDEVELDGSTDDVEQFTLKPLSGRVIADDDSDTTTNTPARRDDSDGEHTGMNLLEAVVQKIIDDGSDYTHVRQLWLRPLSQPVTLSSIPREKWEVPSEMSVIIGWIDMPYDHDQMVCEVPINRNGGSILVSGSPRSGRSTLFQTMVASATMRYTGQQLNFLLYEHIGTTLSAAQNFPNVSMYATGAQKDRWTRMIGEVRKIVEARTRAFAKFDITSVDDYLAHKDHYGTADVDPYGKLVWVIDGMDMLFAELNEGQKGMNMITEIMQFVKQGPGYGVHIVGTNTGTVTSFNRHANQFNTTVQLKLDDPGAILNREEREAMKKLPGNQPGIGVDGSQTDAKGSPRWLQFRSVLPFSGEIKPIGVRKNVPVYETFVDYTDEVKNMGRAISENVAPEYQALRLHEVPPTVPLAGVLDEYRSSHGAKVPAKDRAIPIGKSVELDEVYALTPTKTGNHMIVTGGSQTGKTTALKTHMRAVMDTFTPAEARIIVLDSDSELWDSFAEARERGYANQTSYVRTKNDMADVVNGLVSTARARAPKPGEEAKIFDRSFFNGPELFVYVDTLKAFTSSMYQAGGGGSTTLEDLLGELQNGVNLGIHLVATLSQTAANDFLNPRSFATIFHKEVGARAVLLSSSERTTVIDQYRWEEFCDGRGQVIGAKGSQVVQFALPGGDGSGTAR